MSFIAIAAALALGQSAQEDSQPAPTLQRIEPRTVRQIDPPSLQLETAPADPEAFPGVDWLAGQPNVNFPGVDWSTMRVRRVAPNAFPGVEWRTAGHCRSENGAVLTVERHIPGRGNTAYERIVGERGIVGENGIVGERGAVRPETAPEPANAGTMRIQTDTRDAPPPDSASGSRASIVGERGIVIQNGDVSPDGEDMVMPGDNVSSPRREIVGERGIVIQNGRNAAYPACSG